ncbi:MAG TPA: helix-turn-helix domain-containing protein, partial [Saprospiraceae bacterium]|nr:helix-turn-helix domain-containing protein [Saprospiraceae bacterium]
EQLNGADAEWLGFGQSRIHVSSPVLECGGVRRELTYREAKLLRLFAAHPRELLERDEILRRVWEDEGVQVGRSVDVFVSRLRKKLSGDPSVAIVAVHGVGYKLETVVPD